MQNVNYDTHPELRGNYTPFMRNISPRELGLVEEPFGLKGVLHRIKETAKRIFALQRFTVIYTTRSDRKNARSAINDVVGWTPFKKIEYIQAQEPGYLEDGRLSGKRVLFVDNTPSMQAHIERVLHGTTASDIRYKALEDRSIHFCYYYSYDDFDYDNFEDPHRTLMFHSWIGEGQFYFPKKCHNKYFKQKRQQYAEYFRLVGKKFLNLTTE